MNNDYFEVLYQGVSYFLHPRWYMLTRGEIEYAIDMFKSGHFNDLTSALLWVSKEV